MLKQKLLKKEQKQIKTINKYPAADLPQFNIKLCDKIRTPEAKRRG